MKPKEINNLYDRINAAVEQIPDGKVASYGQIARIVGCTARQVGYAMSTVPVSSPIPWHRVINSQGKISMRSRGDGAQIQRDLLEDEGIVFNARGAVDLAVYGYRP